MNQANLIVISGVIVLAYLVGSIPFSQIIAQIHSGVRLDEVGEGNVGSRNVWHVVGPSWGMLAFLLDCLKGLLVYTVASLLLPEVAALLAGFAVLLGHQFPIFLRGHGGKGLATALGVVLGISPLAGLIGLVILGLANLVFHDMNRSLVVAIITLIFTPILLRQPLWVSAYVVALALLAALKKRLDYSHDSAVWQKHPWEGTAATPGWQPRSGDGPSSPDSRPR